MILRNKMFNLFTCMTRHKTKFYQCKFLHKLFAEQIHDQIFINMSFKKLEDYQYYKSKALANLIECDNTCKKLVCCYHPLTEMDAVYQLLDDLEASAIKKKCDNSQKLIMEAKQCILPHAKLSYALR